MTLSTTPVAGSTTTSPLAGAHGSPGEQRDDPEQEREREQEPADMRRVTRPPTSLSYRRRLEILEGQSAPGLEPVGDGRDLGWFRERTLELVESRGSRRTGRRRPPTYTAPRWTAPTSVVSSLSSATSRNAGSKSATTSSAHSRRRPPRRSPSPGLRWPPTPIE